ncbi:hypothetical protein PULV_b0229 [Pseudoalteromonas ulvae UL12]|nr:hypothetical protein [Pseudoalteromonas ulvae UL12]
MFLAEFSSVKDVFDDSGENIVSTSSFEVGNSLPYAPTHMLSVAVGFESAQNQFDGRIGINYVSEQFVDAANTREPSDSGEEGVIPSYAVLNVTLNYRATEQLRPNVFNQPSRWYGGRQNSAGICWNEL